MSFSNFFQGNIIDPVSFMQVVRKQCSIYQNWNDSERMVLRIENTIPIYSSMPFATF